jgi:hypothetical protein
VLQAYFDDSKQDGNVLILAGHIATVEQWMAFADRWKQALTMSKPKWNVFKMSSVCLKDPVQLERAEYHCRIIEEFVQGAFCIAIPIKPLAKVIAEYRIHPQYSNPYYLAWLLVVSNFRNFRDYGGWTETIDVYFDKQSEERFVQRAWETLADRYGGDIGPFRNAPMFRSDEEFLPLQAADFLAWWARKNWIEHGTFNNEASLFPWEPCERMTPTMYVQMDEQGIRKHLQNTMVHPSDPRYGK